MSCGIKDIDRLEAFRRGTLVEVCGSPSSGRTTLLHDLLSHCTQGGEAAALIDVTDSFDPVSASRLGVILSELLWVRCGMPRSQGRKLSGLEQALMATVLLLQSGSNLNMRGLQIAKECRVKRDVFASIHLRPLRYTRLFPV
jgi:RecA/RadA recombinase